MSDERVSKTAAGYNEHPFPDDPERAQFPPHVWNLAVWHSHDNPTHVSGPTSCSDEFLCIDCSCGEEFHDQRCAASLAGERTT